MTGSFIGVALVATLALKFTDFLKCLSAKDYKAAITQALTWLGAFVIVVLVAHSSLANTVVIQGLHLDNSSWADQLLAGLLVGSFGSVLYDYKAAFDNSDSASTPELKLPGKKRRSR